MTTSEPICSAAMTCELCDAASSGDADCMACDASMPVCTNDGACVECVGNGDCAAAAPVCELTTNVCRGCAANSECSSEVCNLETGACLMTTNIVYVDGGSGADGTMATPCASIAGAQGGLGKVTIMRDTVRVRAGVYVESVTVGAGQTVTFVGLATVSPPTLSDAPGFLVNGGSNVTAIEMTIASADGGSNADELLAGEELITAEEVTAITERPEPNPDVLRVLRRVSGRGYQWTAMALVAIAGPGASEAQ